MRAVGSSSSRGQAPQAGAAPPSVNNPAAPSGNGAKKQLRLLFIAAKNKPPPPPLQPAAINSLRKPQREVEGAEGGCGWGLGAGAGTAPGWKEGARADGWDAGCHSQSSADSWHNLSLSHHDPCSLLSLSFPRGVVIGWTWPRVFLLISFPELWNGANTCPLC